MPVGKRLTPKLHLLEKRAPTPLTRCLAMFLLHQEASHHTPRTIDTYRETLTRFLDFLADRGIITAEAITPTVIREFLVALERHGLADTTVHKHARAVKTFLNFLVSEELLDSSSMRKVAMPRLAQKILPPFTVDEAERLLAACGRGLWAVRSWGDGEGLPGAWA